MLLTGKPVGAVADLPTKSNLHCPRARIQSEAETEQCQQQDYDHHYVGDSAGDRESEGGDDDDRKIL